MGLHITHGLRRNASQRPHAVAYVDGDIRRSWSEMLDRVARFAGVLQSLGAGDRARACVLAENRAAFYEAYMAAPWAGAVLASLNTRWALPEMIEAAQDCAPRVLLVDNLFLEQGRAIRAAVGSIEHLLWIGEGAAPYDALDLETLIAKADPVEDALIPSEDCFALFYTGGTTGRAKGVMMSADGCQSAALGNLVQTRSGSGEVLTHAMPLFHMGAGAFVLMQILGGATGVIFRRFDPAEVLAAVARERIVKTVWVPTMLRAILDHPDFVAADLSSLTTILYGAAPMPESLLRRAMKALPGIRFFQAYGMTETSGVGTLLGPADHDPDGPNPERLRSAGRATLGVDIDIVDANGRVLGPRQTGEVRIRGPVCLGYWNKPEATAEAIRDGWMHTGDGGWLDEDGYLFVVDRVKDMIVTGGENVYSVEVEQALAAHPAVAECAVIGLTDERWGEAVTAVVRLQPDATVPEADLIAHCRGLIAGYKTPRRVIFRDAPLPLSGVGKVLKTELRRLYGSEAVA
jgi:long-chain acyl-CoA synthetase